MDIPTEMVKGSLKVVILETLRGESHYGYSLAQSIRERSNNLLKAGEGSLYPALYKLESEGYISSKWDQSYSPKRKYYSLTENGAKLLKEEKNNWKKLIGVLDFYLNKNLSN